MLVPATPASLTAATTEKTSEVQSEGKCDFFFEKCDTGYMNDFKY